MFVCRRSVFKKSCRRGHQSVFLITTNDVSWPIDARRIQKHVRLHVRFMCLIRHGGLFFSFRTLRWSFSHRHFSFPSFVRLRATLGNVTQRSFFCSSKNMLMRAFFYRPSSFQFSVHVKHKVMALQDQRPSVEARSGVFFRAMPKKKRGFVVCTIKFHLDVRVRRSHVKVSRRPMLLMPCSMRVRPPTC